MEQALATVHGDETGRASDGAPGSAAPVIDIGPFLRQEGRQPVWKAQSHSLREEVIRRLRVELNVPTEQAGRVLGQMRPAGFRQAPGLTLWMAGLMQRFRQVG
jgi:hypothetical protein